jgi:hypothetical protein
MVKKVLLLAVLALALPMAAFANGNIEFTSLGGTLSGGASGLSLSGAVLTQVNALYGGGLIQGSNLGSISFTTGALMSGSLSGGGVFAAGGTFVITGNGVNGVPNGVIFSGAFSSPVTWTENIGVNVITYTLSGALSGTLSNGYQTVGDFHTSSAKFTFSAHKGYFKGTVGSSDTTVVVPEPGTLSLFGTGLLGLAGLVRRRLNLV